MSVELTVKNKKNMAYQAYIQAKTLLSNIHYSLNSNHIQILSFKKENVSKVSILNNLASIVKLNKIF